MNGCTIATNDAFENNPSAGRDVILFLNFISVTEYIKFIFSSGIRKSGGKLSITLILIHVRADGQPTVDVFYIN